MNALVDLVNTKISDACKKTDRCVFVDPTADINRLGGHYCEPGVDEKYWGGSGGWNRCVSHRRPDGRPYRMSNLPQRRDMVL